MFNPRDFFSTSMVYPLSFPNQASLLSLQIYYYQVVPDVCKANLQAVFEKEQFVYTL